MAAAEGRGRPRRRVPTSLPPPGCQRAPLLPARSRQQLAKLEDWLDSKGVKWEFHPTLDVDQFDADKSLHNQARFEPIDEKRVESYVEAMRRGDKFPPVLAHGRMGKLILAGGNHRLQAAIRARKPLDTYVISGDPQTIVLITFESNVRRARLPEAVAVPQNTGSVAWAACPATPDNGCAALTGPLVAGALAEHSGSTAKAYAGDLRCWLRASVQLGACPLHASRHDVQRYLQLLQQAGRAASTRARRLSALACLLRLAREQGLVNHDPLQYIRRPRRSPVVNRAGLTPQEVAALLAAARAHSPRAEVLVGLQAFNGLRVSEVLGVGVEDLDESQGHRVIHLMGKGGKPALVPLPRPVERAVDALRQGRTSGPLVATRTGRAMDRRAAARLVTGLGVEADIRTGRVHCHALRAAWVTNALRAGVPLHVVQDGARHTDPRQTRLYDRSAHALDGHAAYTVASVLEQASEPGGHLGTGSGTGSTAGEPVRLPQLVVPGAGQRHDERELSGEQLVAVEADQVGEIWHRLCPPFSST